MAFTAASISTLAKDKFAGSGKPIVRYVLATGCVFLSGIIHAGSLLNSPEYSHPLVSDQALELFDGPRLFSSPDHDSLSQVLAEVWVENPQVVQAELQLQAAGYEVSGARTGYLPYMQINSAQASSNASSTSVAFVQPLWSGGSTGAQVDEARAQANMALAELNQARLDLGLQVSESYLQVAQAQEQAMLWQGYIDGLNDLHKVITRRAEKGVSPRIDVETALSRLRAAEAGDAANDALLATSRAQLSTLLNRTAGSLSWPAEGDQLSAAQIDSLMPGGVVTAHPQRQRALAEVKVQQARARLSKAQLWPQINLQHQRLAQQSAGDFTPDSSTQLVFQYQTDSGYRGYRDHQAEQQRALAAVQNLKYAQMEIANRIQIAQVERESAAARYQAQTLSAQSAVKLVDSFLRQFQVGRKAWIEVLNAQQEANQALLQTAAAKRDYWMANTRLALEGMAWHDISPDAPPIYIDSAGF